MKSQHVQIAGIHPRDAFYVNRKELKGQTGYWEKGSHFSNVPLMSKPSKSWIAGTFVFDKPVLSSDENRLYFLAVKTKTIPEAANPIKRLFQWLAGV
jgi:hypothetical protein